MWYYHTVLGPWTCGLLYCFRNGHVVYYMVLGTGACVGTILFTVRTYYILHVIMGSCSTFIQFHTTSVLRLFNNAVLTLTTRNRHILHMPVQCMNVMVVTPTKTEIKSGSLRQDSGPVLRRVSEIYRQFGSMDEAILTSERYPSYTKRSFTLLPQDEELLCP